MHWPLVDNGQMEGFFWLYWHWLEWRLCLSYCLWNCSCPTIWSIYWVHFVVVNSCKKDLLTTGWIGLDAWGFVWIMVEVKWYFGFGLFKFLYPSFDITSSFIQKSIIDSVIFLYTHIYTHIGRLYTYNQLENCRWTIPFFRKRKIGQKSST